MLARVFKSGNSMAIRIPKNINLNNVEAFDVQKLGDTLLLKPIGQEDSWKNFFNSITEFKGEIEIPRDYKPQERDFGKIFT